MTPSDFEDTLYDFMRLEKLERFIREGVKVSENEAWRWYQYMNEKLVARYAELRARDMIDLVEIDEAKLKAFFNEHRAIFAEADPHGAGYRVPERVKVEYLIANIADLEKDVVITDRMIAAYYAQHRDDYKLPPAPPVEKEGDDTPAEKKPDEPRYKPLAQVTGLIASRLKREEAKRLSEALMKRVDIEIDRLLNPADGVEEEIAIEFAKLAGKFARVEHKTTDFFAEREVARILPGAPELAKRVFGVGKDGIRQPSVSLESARGYFVVQVLEIKPESIPELTDEGVRQRVEKDFRLAGALDYAAEILREAKMRGSFEEAVTYAEQHLAKRAEGFGKAGAEQEPNAAPEAAKGDAAGKDEAKDDARETGKTERRYLTVGTSRPFSRPKTTYGFRFAMPLSPMMNRAEFADVAFRLDEKEIGVAVEDTGERAAYLIVVIDRLPAGKQSFTLAMDSVIRSFEREKQRAAWEAWVEDVERRVHPSEHVRRRLKKELGWFESDNEGGSQDSVPPAPASPR